MLKNILRFSGSRTFHVARSNQRLLSTTRPPKILITGLLYQIFSIWSFRLILDFLLEKLIRAMIFNTWEFSQICVKFYLYFTKYFNWWQTKIFFLIFLNFEFLIFISLIMFMRASFFYHLDLERGSSCSTNWKLLRNRNKFSANYNYVHDAHPTQVCRVQWFCSQ
jgi:hypothetical protein